MNKNEFSPVLRVKDAAKVLGISVPTIWRRIAANRVLHFKTRHRYVLLTTGENGRPKLFNPKDGLKWPGLKK